MLVADHLSLNRLCLGNVYDVFYMYAFASLYVAFNVVYTLWIPGATDQNGGGGEGERNYVLRELYVNIRCMRMRTAERNARCAFSIF